MKTKKRTSKKMLKVMATRTNGILRHNEYKEIVDCTLEHLKWDFDVKVKIAEIDRGRGYFFEKMMILPAWLDEHDAVYQAYYAIHELTHCLLGYRHNQIFKAAEDLLLDIWDIQIIRKKVYPKKIFFDGKEVYNTPYFACHPDRLSTEEAAA